VLQVLSPKQGNFCWVCNNYFKLMKYCNLLPYVSSSSSGDAAPNNPSHYYSRALPGTSALVLVVSLARAASHIGRTSVQVRTVLIDKGRPQSVRRLVPTSWCVYLVLKVGSTVVQRMREAWRATLLCTSCYGTCLPAKPTCSTTSCIETRYTAL
jgi:hypothetical protein